MVARRYAGPPRSAGLSPGRSKELGGHALELFGIGPMELLLIFVLALIFIGPGKMPEVAASIGKALREFRAASSELTEALNVEIAEAQRKKSELPAENGSGHSPAEAAEAQIVAQGEAAPTDPIEYASAAAESAYQYPEPAPAKARTIDDVLADLAAQEEAAAAKLRAEAEAARLAALAQELARKGMAPLPESLLRPSTDTPLAVVNPTETRGEIEPSEPTTPEPTSTPEPAETVGASSIDLQPGPSDGTETATEIGAEVGDGNGDGLASTIGTRDEVASRIANKIVNKIDDETGSAEGARRDPELAAYGGEALEPSGAGRSEVS